jgi:hypothetical protein
MTVTPSRVALITFLLVFAALAAILQRAAGGW